jgi:hypothetical protein
VGGGGSERHYKSAGGGGDGNIIFSLKVPRHCPLVLLIRVNCLIQNSNQIYRFVRTSQITSPLRTEQVNAIYRFIPMVYYYKYHSSGHYPSPYLVFKTQCFEDWILSPSSEVETSCIYWAQLSRFHLKIEIESDLRSFIKRDRTMDCDCYDRR